MGECQLGDGMRKQRNKVLALAVICHLYWSYVFFFTYASLTVSFFLHEQVRKQWLSKRQRIAKHWVPVFFPRLCFSRRKSLVEDCCTQKFPGKTIFYTGGSRCAGRPRPKSKPQLPKWAGTRLLNRAGRQLPGPAGRMLRKGAS